MRPLILLVTLLLALKQGHTQCTQIFDTLSNRRVYVKVDKAPKVAMMTSIDRKLAAVKADSALMEHSTVEVAFIVNADGQISDGRVINSELKNVGDQILKIFASEKWTPGYCNKKRVPVLVRKAPTFDAEPLGQ